jgi:hypothetical protein
MIQRQKKPFFLKVTEDGNQVDVQIIVLHRSDFRGEVFPNPPLESRSLIETGSPKPPNGRHDRQRSTMFRGDQSIGNFIGFRNTDHPSLQKLFGYLIAIDRFTNELRDQLPHRKRPESQFLSTPAITARRSGSALRVPTEFDSSWGRKLNHLLRP